MCNSVHDDPPESWPKEVVVPLQKPFADSRGILQPLVDVMMRSALIITSKKGTVRANHYHKTDWHYCYVLSGSIEYHHRPVGSKAKPEHVLVKTGELFFTPPLVEHAMVFPEDTTFLTLSRNKRDQKAYEEDLFRVELVRP
jgi:quercetin dioxygenase-like cupin family protein